MWAFRRSRRAFRSIFARSPRSRSLSLSKRRSLRRAQCPVPASRIPLAKDAAPIPNAFESTSLQVYKTTSQQVVDVADLDAGVYFVNIKTENGNVVKRFVKN